MTEEAKNSGMIYKIDAGRGSFTAQAFAEGMLSFMGHNPTFAVRRYGGEIQLTADNSAVDSMLLVIQAETLSLIDKVSDKDAAEIENTMREEVLEISNYPEITLVGNDVSMRQIADTKYAVEIGGVLSLHGQNRKQTIKAEADIVGKTIRAQGDFNLKTSDFNIKKVKALGGTLKVKDEVKISFDITAVLLEG